MIPSFLITFREVIEASLIVAAILGILSKLGDKKGMRTVWWASGSAALVSSFLLIIGSLFGLRIQQIYRGNYRRHPDDNFSSFYHLGGFFPA